MKPVLTSIIPIGIAALGGAFAVFGSYDDSPGGTMLGLLAIVAAMAYGARRARQSQ